MRRKFDKGASPNARYELDAKANAIPVSNTELIRIACDYDKVRKVSQSMIYFDHVDCWYTIWDKTWQDKLNGIHVRVRMLSREPRFIYLFDNHDDTYLTFVERTIFAPTDRASAGDVPVYAMGYAQKIKAIRRRRAEDLQENLSALDSAERNIPEIPDSLLHTGRFIAPSAEHEIKRDPSGTKEESSEKPTSTGKRRKSPSLPAVPERSGGEIQSGIGIPTLKIVKS